MLRTMLWIVVFIFSGLAGCASQRPQGPDVVFIVAGVGGNSGYGGLAEAVAAPGRTVQTIGWGAPPPLFVFNYSVGAIHEDAESDVARRIEQWHEAHREGRIDLIGHSAGCGVVLGAVPRLKDARVNNIILLAPSVSPGYDLTPTLLHMDGKLHNFYSELDTVALSWRTGNFGTYDGVKSKAAGNAGFTRSYPASKVVQHPYDPKWNELGHDGGHFTVRSKRFAEAVIAPLLQP